MKWLEGVGRFGVGLVIGAIASGVLTVVLMAQLLRIDSVDWREWLHVAADVAVIAAVVVAGIALAWQRAERFEQRAAVDAHIRALANQAGRLLQEARNVVPMRALVGRVTSRGNAQGDALPALFTSIAAEAPHASRRIGRAAREVSELFWGTVSRTEQQLARDGAVADTELTKDFDRLKDLLADLATIPPPAQV